MPDRRQENDRRQEDRRKGDRRETKPIVVSLKTFIITIVVVILVLAMAIAGVVKYFQDKSEEEFYNYEMDEFDEEYWEDEYNDSIDYDILNGEEENVYNEEDLNNDDAQ